MQKWIGVSNRIVKWVLMVSRHFRCHTRPVAKISIGVRLMHEFMPLKQFLVWSQWTCPLHYFGSKTLVSAAYKARVYASGTVSYFFCNEQAQSTIVGPKLMFRVVSASKTISCFLAMILVSATSRVHQRNGAKPPKNEFWTSSSGLGMFVARKQETVLDA